MSESRSTLLSVSTKASEETIKTLHAKLYDAALEASQREEYRPHPRVAHLASNRTDAFFKSAPQQVFIRKATKDEFVYANIFSRQHDVRLIRARAFSLVVHFERDPLFELMNSFAIQNGQHYSCRMVNVANKFGIKTSSIEVGALNPDLLVQMLDQTLLAHHAANITMINMDPVIETQPRLGKGL